MQFDTAEEPSRSVNRSVPQASDEVRAPIPPVRQVLVEEPFPERPRIPLIRDGFRDFQQEARWREQGQEAKIRTLEDLFRPPLDLMFTGSMDAAKDEGTRVNKWLLVNIQNTEEFACQVLNRDVWSNAAVKSIINEHFIFWQVYHTTRDGQRYMQFYGVNSFPYVAILDPRTGECLRTWTSAADSNLLCEWLTDFLQDHQRPNPSPQTQQQQQPQQPPQQPIASSSSSIATSGSIQELNEDPLDHASVRNNHDGNSEMLVDENTDQIPTCKVQKQVDGDKYREYFGSSETEAELVLRFPDGKRESFRLPCDSKLKAVFLFLNSRGFGLDKYDLVTNFPRRNIHDLPGESTLQDVDLQKEQLYIQLKS